MNVVNNFESIFSPEKEKKIKTSVELYLFRHGKKDGAVLSDEGKKEAREMGEKLKPNKKMAISGGSFIDRTLESSIRVMMPEEFEDIDSFSNIESKMNEEIKVGKKFFRDNRLGFNIDGPINKDIMKSFNEGNYIKWLYNESDNMAIEKSDLVSTSYLRQAGNIAEIIKKYISVSDNFNKLVNENEKYQSKDKNKLERYLGAHQGVVECFILDLVKRQEGESVANKLAESMGNGWSELEGVHIEIRNDSLKKSIFITYPDINGLKKIEIDPKIIDEIILERKDFEKKVRN